MTGKELTRHLKTTPFAPFRMYLADGRVLRVNHPEFLAYIPGTRTCVVADPDTLTYNTVDLLLVTSIETDTGNAKPPRRKRG
ncbi:MAG: hypothetical protein V3W34_02630 [Phycisphaerae bacterium]